MVCVWPTEARASNCHGVCSEKLGLGEDGVSRHQELICCIHVPEHEIRAGHGVLRDEVVRKYHKKKKNQVKLMVFLRILELSVCEEDLDEPRYGCSLASRTMLCEKLVAHQQGEKGKQTRMHWGVLLTHKPTDG